MKRIPMYAFLFLMVMFISLPAHAQSLTWQPDQMISSLTESTRTPAIAVSGDRAVAVWAQWDGSFDHVYASYSTNRGETWTAPQLIENVPTAARNTQVVMSGSNVVVIWEQIISGIFKVYANYSNDGGATWQATATPLTLSSGTDWDASQTSVAISGDRVVVVWNQSPDGNYNRVYSNQSSDMGATWSGATQISDLNSASAEFPHVAISGNNVVAVWLHYDSVSGYKRVRANYSTNGGETWGSDANIENLNAEDRYRPKVAVSGSNVVAVWDTWDGSYSHIHSNRTAFFGGALSWNTSSVQLLEDTASGSYDYGAKIAMSGNNVIVMWQRWDEPNFALMTSQSANAGANWSSPTTLDESANGIEQHQLIMTDRYAVAIWQCADGSLAKVYASHSFDKGETWSEQEAIDSSTSFHNDAPQVAASGNNIVSVHARYDYFNNRTNIYANYATFSGGGGIVVGDGGGGGCFIATTAFGSPLAGQVDILRKFRDGYLLTNSLGRKFVGWYYQNGPVAAKFIEDKPLARAFVQASLYPLVGFSFLLIHGYLPFVMLGLMLAALIFFRFRPGRSQTR